MIIEIEPGQEVDLSKYAEERLQFKPSGDWRSENSNEDLTTFVMTDSQCSVKELEIWVPSRFDTDLMLKCQNLETLTLCNYVCSGPIVFPASLYSLTLGDCEISALEFTSENLNYFVCHSSRVASPIFLPESMHWLQIESTKDDLPRVGRFPKLLAKLSIVGFGELLNFPDLWDAEPLSALDVNLDNVALGDRVHFLQPKVFPDGLKPMDWETNEPNKLISLNLNRCRWSPETILHGEYGRLQIFNSGPLGSIDSHLAKELRAYEEFRVTGWNISSSNLTSICKSCPIVEVENNPS